MEWTNQSADFTFMAPSRLDPNQPIYKPEYWDKVIELDQWTNRDDPVMTCIPLGHPRHRSARADLPHRADITMFYRGGLDGGGGYPDFRMIPLNGQPHDPQRALQYTYMGYTVGRWEGDTLVLDSIGFTDETWLGRGGKFHSDQMRVIEKFTRKGNTMLYEVTVEDPVVLVEPWVMNPRTLRLANNPAIVAAERGSCTDTELARSVPDSALVSAARRLLLERPPRHLRIARLARELEVRAVVPGRRIGDGLGEKVRVFEREGRTRVGDDPA